MKTQTTSSFIEKSSSFEIGLVIAVEIVIFGLLMAFMFLPGTVVSISALLLGLVIFQITRKKPEWIHLVEQVFRRRKLVSFLGIGVLIVLVPFIMAGEGYWLFNLVMVCIFLIASLGLNLQLGSTGIVNLSGAAFYGVGAYTAALLSTHYGVPSGLNIILGGIMAGLFSILLFIPLLRTSGHYVALVSIAFQFIFVILAENLEFTGGPQGVQNIPRLNLLGYQFGQSYTFFGVRLSAFSDFFLFVAALTVIAIVVSVYIYQSWVGITLSTIRDDEIVAKTCGINVNHWKMIIFALGNVFMGVAGAFYAHLVGSISPPIFAFDRSLVLVSIVILGGMDNVFGVILGAFLLVLLPEKLRFIGDYRLLIYGLVLIFGLIFRPQGLLPFSLRDFAKLAKWSTGKDKPEQVSKPAGGVK